jgi:putative transposase
MARQARIEYPGAVHHITSRGNNRQAIFLDDRDRKHFLALLGEAVRRYGWLLTAWVLMTNHFHLVIHTPEPTLSDGMKWLLGSYVSWFNKRHHRTGHLFGDRFHSYLIQAESYLTEVVRYVVLNPVRAHMVERPEDYRWSSYRATAGLARAPEWLALGTLAPFFGEPDEWQANFRSYVAEKIGSDERLWDKVQNQIYLGTEAWMKKVRKVVESKPRSDDHPRAQREVGRPNMVAIVDAVAGAFGVSRRWIQTTRGNPARRVAAWLGWYEGLERLRSIAAGLRLRSSGRVSDLVRQCERMLVHNPALQARVDLVFAALA